MTATKEQIKATLDTVRVVADAIKEAKQIPNGHLYTMVMPHMSFELYTRIIGLLKSSGLIREENNMLIWNLK